MNPERIANNDNANTHISVLLSTNNKNAHIQLVNHISIKLHHIKKAQLSPSSQSSFFLNKGKDSFKAHSPKSNTNTQLKAFKFTAIVSLAIFNTEEIAVHIEKKYAI